MKIGLDCNIKRFSENIVDFLKDSFFIVDMFMEKRKNEGYDVHRRVLEANSSRLDLFIGIYLSEENDEDNTVIYYDKTFFSKSIASYIYDNLRGIYKDRNLYLRGGGDEFYILKEIEAPSILILGGENGEELKLEAAMKEIIKQIFEVEKKFR
ncbi:MAG: hypothetical protein ACRC28_16700 [Clostridium sp.]|uniref:hypothetical protein n=1 Tax=Clostridium sp. TaxID=1506 RepID=UPI003F3B8AAA